MARDFAKRFYSSKAWQDCRNEYAKHAHHLCENCLAKGIYKPGVIVHHIEELTPMNISNPEISMGFDNLRMVCRDCHAEEHRDYYESKKAETKKRYRNRRFFVGENGKIIAIEPPSGQKNTR